MMAFLLVASLASPKPTPQVNFAYIHKVFAAVTIGHYINLVLPPFTRLDELWRSFTMRFAADH